MKVVTIRRQIDSTKNVYNILGLTISQLGVARAAYFGDSPVYFGDTPVYPPSLLTPHPLEVNEAFLMHMSHA